MGWKDSARRLTTGGKIELKTLGGFWVIPKKYSIAGNDAIGAIQRKMLKGVDKKSLSSLIHKRSEGFETPEAMVEAMEPEELMALFDSNSLEKEESTRVKIVHGLYEYGYQDEDSSKDVKGFATEVLEFEDVALEVLSVIEKFNHPLANPTSSTSKMSQDGSTEVQPSSTETVGKTEESPLS